MKNNVFDDWVTETNLVNKFKRKFQEQYLALELEKRMSKEDILELYMNSINLGQNTLGVQAASMQHFRTVIDIFISGGQNGQFVMEIPFHIGGIVLFVLINLVADCLQTSQPYLKSCH